MPERKRVLIVDDVGMVRGMLTAALEGAGYEVATAADGLEAVTTVGFVKPDLIIMDLSMPVLGGASAIRAIRANPVLAPVPIIVLTAYADYDNVRQVIHAGANDVLVKQELKMETLLDDVRKKLMEADPLWEP